MNKRPRSITVISWLFVATGVIGLAYHATEFKAERPFEVDLVWVCFVRLLAILCIVLGILHSALQLFVHGLLFAVILYLLFRPQASAYFRGAGHGNFLRRD